MAGDYTRREIDTLLANMKNDYINRDNALKNDYTSKYNSLSAKFGEYYKKTEVDTRLKKLEEGQWTRMYSDTLEVTSYASYRTGTHDSCNYSLSARILRNYYIQSTISGVTVNVPADGGSETNFLGYAGAYASNTTTYNGHTITINGGQVYVDNRLVKNMKVYSGESYSACYGETFTYVFDRGKA